MKKFIILLAVLFWFAESAVNANAFFCPINMNQCNGVLSGPGTVINKSYQNGDTLVMKIDISNYDKSFNYYGKVSSNDTGRDEEAMSGKIDISKNGKGSNSEMGWEVTNNILTLTIKNKEALSRAPLTIRPLDTHFVYLQRALTTASDCFCKIGEYKVGNQLESGCKLTISQNRNNQTCYYGASNGSSSTCFQKGIPINVKIDNLSKDGKLFSGKARIVAYGTDWDNSIDISNGSGVANFNQNNDWSSGPHKLTVKEATVGINYEWPGCSASITIPKEDCNVAACNTTPTNAASGQSSTKTNDPFYLCNQIPASSPDFPKCTACVGQGGSSGNGSAANVWTAIGCVPVDVKSIVKTAITLGLNISGGIALLMILSAGLMLSTSQGDQKRTQDAKEMITNAVIGLFFIIFSIVILQFVGVTILHIPGFGEA